MGKVIEDDLQFHSDADKQAWIDESTMWRLPYWDWANPNKGSAPTLFMPASVNIRVPAKDGSQPAPENVPNPLYRYQLKVDGLPKKMGDLPKPYTVDSVKLTADGKELVLPVCTFPGYVSIVADFLSGRNALVQADGASTVPMNKIGLTASTIPRVSRRLSNHTYIMAPSLATISTSTPSAT